MNSKNGKPQNADNQNADNQNANLIEDVLKGEVEHSQKKVKGLISVGRSCLEDSTDLDEATQYYEDGIRYWHSNELDEAYCSFDMAEHALMKALKNAGIIRRIFFGTITHSYVPIVISLIFFIIFSYLLYHIESMKSTPMLPTLLGVPLWAALSGGLGGCAGVLYGVVWDQDYYGVVRYPWQLWFSVLPIFALTSGYLIYILIDTGIAALGGSPTGLVGNTTALEQQKVLGSETKALFCFLAGFWTYNIIDKLKALLDNVMIFKK